MKRLSKSDYLFSLLFIFMLVFAMGAFFYGMQLGMDKAEAKYERLLATSMPDEDGAAYPQTNLVSFYYTVYEPFQQFRHRWFSDIDLLGTGESGKNGAAVLKALGKLAKSRYEQLVDETMPKTSPLLFQAHENLLKSLKLFEKSAETLANRGGTTLAEDVERDPYYLEAKQFALLAQSQFFQAIDKWNAAETGRADGQELLRQTPLALESWSGLNLHLKNRYMAELLQNRGIFASFSPLDAVIRVDEVIRSGQAAKMNLGHVDAVAELLIETGAIRPGDYASGKQKWYGDERVPRIPMFE